MSAWLTLRGALAVPAVAAFGCGSAEPNLPDDTRWTSEHFVYRARTGDDTVCEGVLATLEKHFDAMQSYLGFSWPPGRVIQYFKFENIEDLKANSGCPLESGGCQREDRVFAADPMQEHELIHAYLEPLGLPPPLILEGIAQALSCSGFASQADAAAPATWRITERRDAYQPGQWLVAHLLKNYATERFLELYSSVRSDADHATLSAAFESVYGAPLDDVWDAATADPDPESGCVFAWECQGEPAVFDEPLTLAERCDLADRYRTLSVNESAGLDLSARPNFAYVRSCAGSPAAPFAERLEGLAVNGRTLTELERGKYLLKSDTSTTVEARTILPALLGDDCGTAPVQTFQEFPAGRRLVIPRREATRFFRFSTARAADLWLWPEEETDTAAACHGCNDEDCVTADGTAGYRGGPDFVLRIQGAADALGFADFTLQLTPAGG